MKSSPVPCRLSASPRRVAPPAPSRLDVDGVVR